MIVFSFGGSIINRKDGIGGDEVRLLCQSISSSCQKAGIVVGGGYGARMAISEAKKKGLNNFFSDLEAIRITRENAKVVSSYLPDCSDEVPSDFLRAKHILRSRRFVCMGGTIPGITTDADAVLLAECLESERVINISSSDGIYTGDPNSDPSATRISRMTHDELVSLASQFDRRSPGTHFPFDIMASLISRRSNIRLDFVGRDPENLKNCILGKKFIGTTVLS